MKRLSTLGKIFAVFLLMMTSTRAAGSEFLVLGGGCFWCTEAAYELLPGVKTVVSGYAGGARDNPSYEQVCTGASGHAEVIRIEYDPAVVTLDRLLDFFWEIHDPTTLNRQGADRGTQYRSVIYYADETQKTAVLASRDRANPGWAGKIVTEISPLPKFFEAEAYHQDYYRRNPEGGYCQMVIRPKLEKVGKKLRVE
jgi:peptide-methionine (S)-S-oxide reductase